MVNTKIGTTKLHLGFTDALALVFPDSPIHQLLKKMKARRREGAWLSGNRYFLKPTLYSSNFTLLVAENNQVKTVMPTTAKQYFFDEGHGTHSLRRR